MKSAVEKGMEEGNRAAVGGNSSSPTDSLRYPPPHLNQAFIPQIPLEFFFLTEGYSSGYSKIFKIK